MFFHLCYNHLHIICFSLNKTDTGKCYKSIERDSYKNYKYANRRHMARLFILHGSNHKICVHLFAFLNCRHGKIFLSKIYWGYTPSGLIKFYTGLTIAINMTLKCYSYYFFYELSRPLIYEMGICYITTTV